MTRCKAVDGTMNTRQFLVYDQVLQLHQIARAKMKPGATIASINDELSTHIAEALLQLGLIKKSDLETNHDIIKKFMPHGVAHFLGMDVHDYGDRYVPLSPGMVITCEPGIYIPQEGIGIRLENDVLITEDGHEDLMENYEL
jgi:Xaa-Pro aminopeptidase